MSTDRELLELAAKAAGITCEIVELGNSTPLGINEYNEIVFDPLKDDGHALRLAVKLGISLDFNFADTLGEVSAAQVLQPYQYENMAEDPYAATRRAIVRAAAEIGKDME